MAPSGAPPAFPNQPKDTDFTQQRLYAWRPMITPLALAALMAGIALVFIPLGIAALNASATIIEVTARYDDVSGCTGGAGTNKERKEFLYKMNGSGVQCSMELEITDTMEPPIYVYYELHNYFQNHRRYVKSRSDGQLRGDTATGQTFDEVLGMPDSGFLDTCAPQKYAPDDSDSDHIIDPCGLVAWTYFNDTYEFTRRTITPTDGSDGPSTEEGRAPILVDETGIAWETDMNQRFAHYQPENFNDEPEYRGGGTIDGYLDNDEHFMVWMRTALLPNFRKLWGRIDTKLNAGDILELSVLNRYNTYGFDGEKHIVLSTTSWLGGKNRLIGALLVFLGVCSCTFCAMFVWIHLDPNTREFGDERSMSWNRNTQGATLISTFSRSFSEVGAY